MIYLYFIFSIFIVFNSIFSSTYFISSSIGKDTNNGLFPIQGKDKNGPFASFEKFSKKSFFKPGDKIFLKSGDTWENLKDIRFRFSGNKNKPILISSYGGSNFPELRFKANVAGFYIHDFSQLIEFINIEKISLQGNENAWGIFISHDEKGGDTKNITLKEMIISNFKIGIHSQISSNLSIENSEIFSMGEMGILGGVKGSGLTIRNNRIYRNGFKCPREPSIYCHNIYLSYGNNIVIEKNTIYGASNFGIILHGNLQNVKIIENEIYKNNNAIAVDPGYEDLKEGFLNVDVSRNRVHEQNGKWLFSFQSIENLTFSENIIYDEPKFNIEVRKRFAGDKELKNARFFKNLIIGPVKKRFSFHDSLDEKNVIWNENQIEEKLSN